MSRNIVICCDGTGNEIEKDLSNVLKLYRFLKKDETQIVYYDPGIGTIGLENAWGKFKQKVVAAFCLATGAGLDQNVLRAYKFLVQQYQPDDKIYLFGFSRGAYTARVLAAFMHVMGLLRPEQINLCESAYKAYKSVSVTGDFKTAWAFNDVTKPHKPIISFLGVWDTVSSVLIPRWDKILHIDQQRLPHTRNNPSVEVFRHAIAIDERRRMFQINSWDEGQVFKANPFNTGDDKPQDCKQVWFAGCHADVGGGYPESESAIAKYPLAWMVGEAKHNGLKIIESTYNWIVLGKDRENQKQDFIAPNFLTKIHNSMLRLWLLVEWLPRQEKYKAWPFRKSRWGFYTPACEPRFIKEGAYLHHSVVNKLQQDPTYKPINIPKTYETVFDKTGKE